MRLIAATLIFFCYLAAHAESKKGQGITFYLENDSRDIGGPGSDNAYTSGFKLSYISADDKIPSWATPVVNRSALMKESLKNSNSNFGISLAHQIYTPNDIRNPNLIPDDRPYAAWLYVGFSAHFKSEVSSHSAELNVGMIGPEAAGASVQNGYHRVIGKYNAEGWSHQLETEPTLQLSYQQRLRFFQLGNEEGVKYFDVIPFFGGALGNVAVDVHAGGMIRFGHNLPQDFGATRPSSADGDNFVTPITTSYMKPSLYVFAAGRSTLIGRNIFLDGNTFRSSHHVQKIPLIFETELGAAGIYNQWSVIWRFVTRSPEFRERSVVNSFASISLGYAF